MDWLEAACSFPREHLASKHRRVTSDLWILCPQAEGCWFVSLSNNENVAKHDLHHKEKNVSAKKVSCFKPESERIAFL